MRGSAFWSDADFFQVPALHFKVDPHPSFPLFSRRHIHRQASGDVAEWSKALPC